MCSPKVEAQETALKRLFFASWDEYAPIIRKALEVGDVVGFQHIIRLRPGGHPRSVQFNLMHEKDLPRPGRDAAAS